VKIGNQNLRGRPELENHFGQPVFQHRPLVGSYIGKGKAHPAVAVAVDNLGLSLEDTLVAENSQLDHRSLGERVQRFNIAAPKTQFGRSCWESSFRREFDHLSRSHKGAASNRSPFRRLRVRSLSGGRRAASGLSLGSITGHSFYLPEYLTFVSLGTEAQQTVLLLCCW